MSDDVTSAPAPVPYLVPDDPEGDWFYLIREYDTRGAWNLARFDAYITQAFTPAAERLGIGPVGVFVGWSGAQSLAGRYVIVQGADLAILADLDRHLSRDEEYVRTGEAFLNADPDQAPFHRVTSRLIRALPGLARLSGPARHVDAPGRMFELRTYDQPTFASHALKAELFVEQEAALLDEVGFEGIMYGVDIVGTAPLRITYMWCYPDMEHRMTAERAWFTSSKAMAALFAPRYKNVPSAIGNTILLPAAGNQI